MKCSRGIELKTPPRAAGSKQSSIPRAANDALLKVSSFFNLIDLLRNSIGH